MIEYNIEKKVDFGRLLYLFTEVGWTDKVIDIRRVEEMVNNSQIVVTAWDGDLMVGFARCLTDYVFNGQINNVVVDSKYRGRGIGKELIARILSTSKQVTYILRADSDNIGFYNRLGFKPTDLALVYSRRQ